MDSGPLRRRVRTGIIALGSFLTAASGQAQDASAIRRDDLIRAALETSPQIAAARARVNAARGGRVTAATLPNPLLTFQIENGGYPGQGTPAGFEPERSLFGTFPLEALYQRGPRIRVADEELRAAEADLDATRWTVTLDAARAFYRAALAQVAVGSAGDVRKGLDELTAYNEARAREGSTAEGDLIRVRIERDRAAMEETVARAEWARATTQLRPFLDDARRKSSGPLPRVEIDAGAASETLAPLSETLTRALARQPGLLSARARVTAARAEVELQRTLTVRQLGATFGNKRVAGENTMIAGLTVPLPLFNRNRGEVIRASAERAAMEHDAEWTERTLLARIEGAYEAARLLGQQVRALHADLIHRAEESRTISLAAYREGTGSLLQVLDASRTLGDVRLAYARLLFAHRESLLELDAASGGDPLSSLGSTNNSHPTGGSK